MLNIYSLPAGYVYPSREQRSPHAPVTPANPDISQLALPSGTDEHWLDLAGVLVMSLVALYSRNRAFSRT